MAGIVGALGMAVPAGAAPRLVHPVRVDAARAGFYDELGRGEVADGIVGDGERMVSYIPAARPRVVRTRDTWTGRTFDTALHARGCDALSGNDTAVLVGCVRGGKQRDVLLVDLGRRTVRRVRVPRVQARDEAVLMEAVGTRWLQGRRCRPSAPGNPYRCSPFYRDRRTGSTVPRTGAPRDLNSRSLALRCGPLLGLLPDTEYAQALSCAGSTLVGRSSENPDHPAMVYRAGRRPVRLRPRYVDQIFDGIPPLGMAMDRTLLVWTATPGRPSGLALGTGRRMRFAVERRATVKVTRDEVVFAEHPLRNTTRILVVGRSELPR